MDTKVRAFIALIILFDKSMYYTNGYKSACFYYSYAILEIKLLKA